MTDEALGSSGLGSVPIRVLVVEDEQIAAQAHAVYVGRVEGFAVAAVVGTGQEALQILSREPVDLVLLDMNLPDHPGLSIVRAMRAAGHRADVIAVTSVRELDAIRAALSLGVVQYILKPFVFAMLRERLETYRDYRLRIAETSVDTQSQVDSIFASARGASGPIVLAKGMTESLLARVCDVLRRSETPVSARELGDAVHVSRVTARRYAEHLLETGRVRRSARYTGSGRPEVTYEWVG